MWFLWALVLIVIFGGLYWVITVVASPKKPTVVATKNVENKQEEILIFDTTGTKVIGKLPFSDKNQSIAKSLGLNVIANRQLVPASSSSSSPKSPKGAECLRDCYEPGNIFLLPPDYIK